MGLRILIVEDDLLQAESLEAVLTLEGHLVCGVAATGERAIRLAREATPDVVLMDVSLRGPLDGIETARRIKSRSTCRVVFLTAFDDRRALRRMGEIAPDAILRKPARLAEIAAAIEPAAERGRAPRRPVGEEELMSPPPIDYTGREPPQGGPS